MAIEQFKNTPTPASPSTAWTTLNGALDASQTDVTFTSLAVFPSSPQYRILVESELMLVTAHPGGQVGTVTRGIEGTTAATHASGASVYHVTSAAGLANHPRSMTTSGDTEYLNASLSPTRLAAPSDGSYVVAWATAVPSWVAAVTAASATAFTNKTGSISQWTNDASYTTLAAVAGVGYLTTVTAHALLSATHSDTTAAAVARGALITGQGASPAWARLAIGTSGYVLTSDGTDVAWAALSVAVGNVSGLGTGVATFLATPSSANLATAVTDETGSGSLVFATSPTLVTPTLGVAAGTSLTLTAQLYNAGDYYLGRETNVNLFPGLWFGTAADAPTVSNYSLLYSGGLLVNDSASLTFQIGNSDRAIITNSIFRFSPAAHIVSQYNGTNPQAFLVYRTYTDASNYERQALRSGSGYFEWAAETAGTGTDNLDLRLTPAGTGGVTSAAAITAMNGTAIPAGGTAGAGLKVSSTANFGVFFGSGAPSLSAAKGSLYLRSDGSGIADRAYVNTDGGTTWTAIATAA